MKCPRRANHLHNLDSCCVLSRALYSSYHTLNQIHIQCQRSQDHHHHLLCRRCGQTREFVAPEIEKLAEVIAKKYNFTDTDHIIEISGICKDCK